tara:strand:+ start:231 stop:491 length:261 start_codon:yes stop_codon:yes gene_type:complete
MELPDLNISPLMWVRLTEGLGALHSGTILAILPDTTAPKKRSLIVSSAFPEGLTVEGDSETLLMQWWLEVGHLPGGDDDDDDDEED